MLRYMSTNKSGLKYYFSDKNFIGNMYKRHEMTVIKQSGLYKIFKCHNAYILPYDYCVYGVYYIVTTDFNALLKWFNEYCL